MDGEQCDGCYYWKHVGQVRGGRVPTGLCRKHAPRPADEEYGKSLKDYCGTWWPETDADDWCGEFRPRTPLPVVSPG